MITATLDQTGEVLSITIGDGRRTRTYRAAQILDALALADRRARQIVRQDEMLPYVEIGDLLVKAAELFRLPIAAIVGPSRQRRITLARFAVARAARRAGHTWVAIGEALGGRDHTTIIAAEQRAADLEQTDRWFATQMAALLPEAA
jgi:chromosomal replication initiation ATPase DnaA